MEGELEETTFEGEREDDFGGSWDDERSGSEGRGRCYRSKSYSALQQSPLPMATTPPLSPELLERGQARCKAEFSRSNTWDRLAAAGLYAVSLWKVSQELIEEKAKVLIDGPVGKLKIVEIVSVSSSGEPGLFDVLIPLLGKTTKDCCLGARRIARLAVAPTLVSQVTIFQPVPDMLKIVPGLLYGGDPSLFLKVFAVVYCM
ncbi:unnamed protein product [Calypogeia fissa]